MKTLNYLTSVIAFILITTNVSQAQIAVGAKIGINGSTQSDLGQVYNNDDFKTDAQFGLQLDYRFHSILSLQLEGNYISKGSKINLAGNTGKTDGKRNYEYVNIPLLLKARLDNELGLNEKCRIFLYAGPYYSALISATDYLEDGDEYKPSNIENEAEKHDLGISLGGGVTYVLNPRNELFLDLRYDMGLSEVVSTNNNLRNKTISLSIGYRFF